MSRIALALAWIYQGLVPKLIAPEGELELVKGLGTFHGWEREVVTAAGIAQILLGLAHLVPRLSRAALWTSLVVLPLLTIGGVLGTPALLTAPFSPVPLAIAMMALAAIGLRRPS